MILDRLKKTIKVIDWKNIRIKSDTCPLCRKNIIIKLNSTDLGIRCLRCGASFITMSFVSVLNELVPNLCEKSVYELSSRGPLFEMLKKRSKKLFFSEYFEGIEPGQFKGEIQCQDVQSLTFPDEFFDVCTSTEVFEHVANDADGFREIFRALKPKGLFILTVPLELNRNTIERAFIKNKKIVYLMPAEYHGDDFRGWGKVLCFRDYGKDIVEKIKNQGFRNAEIVTPHQSWFGCFRPVVVAYKN